MCADGCQRPSPRLLFSLSNREDTGGHTSVVYAQAGRGFEIAQAQQGMRVSGFSLLDPPSEFASFRDWTRVLDAPDTAATLPKSLDAPSMIDASHSTAPFNVKFEP